jgi:hypothetical protein
MSLIIFVDNLQIDLKNVYTDENASSSVSGVTSGEDDQVWEA